MRLDELIAPSFKPILAEAETAPAQRTILISPAEIYQMSGQTPPQIKGPGGRLVQLSLIHI